MNTEKLERANILAKSLIPKVNELLNMSTKSMRSSLADAIYGLSENLCALYHSYRFAKLKYVEVVDKSTDKKVAYED